MAYFARICRKFLTLVLVGLVTLYQVTLRGLLGGQCRFYPSCSVYAKEAISSLGPLRGGWLSVKRLCKCNPWHCGGHDPVPSASHTQMESPNRTTF